MKTLPARSEILRCWEEASPALHEYLEGLKKEVRTFLKAEGIHAHVKARVKDFPSYYQKLLRLRQTEPDLDITDLIALRIVCPFLEETHRMEAFFKNEFAVIESDHKGRKRNFQEFGYESIHLLIEGPSQDLLCGLPKTSSHCEVQIRTTLQDAWAEVEHQLVYKSSLSLPKDGIRRKLASLNASLSLSDLIFQELRDHQLLLRRQEERRRNTLREKLTGYDSLSATTSLEGSFRSFEEEPPVEEEWKSKDVRIKEHLEALVLQALKLHSEQKYPDAIAVYSYALKGDLKEGPRSMLLNHRGMAYFVLGAMENAKDDFLKAIEIDSQNVRAYGNLGICYRVNEEVELALEALEKALEIDPDNTEVLFQKSLCLKMLKRFSEALETCHKVLTLKADHSEALELEKQLRSKVMKA